MAAYQSDINPLKHAGEGWFQTDEYFPQDIRDPYVLGDVLGEGEYYPSPENKPRKWPPAKRY